MSILPGTTWWPCCDKLECEPLPVSCLKFIKEFVELLWNFLLPKLISAPMKILCSGLELAAVVLDFLSYVGGRTSIGIP